MLSRSTLELCQRVLLELPTATFLDPETHQMAPIPSLAFAELHAALQETAALQPEPEAAE